MKRMITFMIVLLALTACASSQTEAGLPNPASAYCEQNGNKLEIVNSWGLYAKSFFACRSEE